VGQERRAREAAQRAAEEERVRLEEALRKIGTLESRERLLQVRTGGAALACLA
jgi:DNA-binding TFAR19-related protein (PDSD5 family)